MNFRSGHAWYNFKKLDNRCLQAVSKYSHTWDDTGIEGISVGVPLNIQFDWGHRSHAWTKASEVGQSSSCP